MTKRKLLAATLAIVLGTALGGALVMATPWTDTQTTSGNVTVTTAQDELYICDVSGTTDPPVEPGGPSGVCFGDDSGADEIILETDEALTPNSSAIWTFRLVNIGTAAWDITAGATPAITETADPNADCANEPVVELSADSSTAFDNHEPAAAPFPGSPAIGGLVVHVAPGSYEQLNITASVPSSLPAECQGNAWDIVLQFSVSTH